MKADVVSMPEDDGYSITYSIDMSKVAVYARNCIICGGQIILYGDDPTMVCQECKDAILEVKETRKSRWIPGK